MVWQDIVISIIQLVLAVSLLPQVIKGFKEKKGVISFATSIPTFICLYVMAFCFYTLSLNYSAMTILIAAALWTVLFIQRIVYGKA